jgi:hypothetical protein
MQPFRWVDLFVAAGDDQNVHTICTTPNTHTQLLCRYQHDQYYKQHHDWVPEHEPVTKLIWFCSWFVWVQVGVSLQKQQACFLVRELSALLPTKQCEMCLHCHLPNSARCVCAVSDQTVRDVFFSARCILDVTDQTYEMCYRPNMSALLRARCILDVTDQTYEMCYRPNMSVLLPTINSARCVRTVTYQIVRDVSALSPTKQCEHPCKAE